MVGSLDTLGFACIDEPLLLTAACACTSTADDASARLAKETGKPDIIGAVALDTSKPESISAAVQNLVKGFEGKLDTLINNAAVRTPGLPGRWGSVKH